MKKAVKKIITSITAVTVILQAFFLNPAAFISADSGEKGILVYSADFSSDKILQDMTISNLDVGGDPHTEVKVENGELVIQSLKEIKNKTNFAKVELPFSAVLDTDEENGTVTTTETLSGKLAVEMDLEQNLDVTESSSQGRWELRPGQDAEEYGQIRFGNEKNSMLYVDDPRTILNLDTIPFKQKGTFRMEFDTNEKKFYPAGEDAVDFQTGTCSKNIFNCIKFLFMAKLNKTSYVKISRLEVFKLPAANPSTDEATLTAALEAMPDKLAENIFAVTEDITLPEIAGDVAVEWSSSNPFVISTEGVVNRGTEDAQVTLTATLKSGEFIYKKAYTMNVYAEGKEVEPTPTPTPTPDDKRVVADFVYGDMKDPLAGWKKPTDIYANMSCEDDGIVIRSQNTNLQGGTSWSWISADFNFTLDEDEENGTQLQASQMTGKYAVEIDLETDLSSQRKTAEGAVQAGYIDFRVGYRGDPNAGSATWDSSIAMLRMISDPSAAGGTRNLIRCAMPASGGVNYGQVFVNRGDRFKIKLVFDTQAKTFQYYVDDVLIKQSANNKTGTIPFSPDSTTKQMFSSFLFGTQAVLDDGSYVKIYEIKVTNLETDTSENGGIADAYKKYAEFPAAITDDCKDVTRDVDVPILDGVKWSSDTPEIISADGKVNRWVDDVPVSLSGNFSTTNAVGETLKFAKVYNLNIKAQDSAETTVVLEDNPNEAERNWEFSAGKGEHSITDNMLTLTHKGGAEGYSGIRMLNVEIPEERKEYEALYSANHSGIYDLEFDAVSHVTGTYPTMVEPGYLDPATGVFTGIGSLNFAKDGVALGFGSKTQSIQSTADTYKLKLRFDTKNKKMWAYSNGIMKTPFAGTSYIGSDFGIVNAVRVLFDPNANSGDSLSIGNVRLTRKLNIQNAAVNALISETGGICISTVTDSPENISGGIKNLPKQINGMNVIWESDSDFVDVETGKVYKGLTMQEVVLTAKIISGNLMVSKEFYLKIPAASDRTELLESAANLLKWSAISNQPIDDIRYNIDLPAEGQFGTTITWRSSAPEKIGNNGKINKQTIIEDGATVTLTAEISLGAEMITKSFDIHLNRRGIDTKVLSDSSVTSSYSFTLDGETDVAIVCDALFVVTVVKNGNGELAVKDSAGKTVALIQVDGNNILCNSSKVAEVVDGIEAKLSVYVMPDKDKIAVWANGMLVADSVSSAEEFDDISSVVCTGGIKVKNIDMYLDDYGIFEINMHRYNYLDALGNGYVTENLSLFDNAFLGASVQWSFNDSVSSENGVVTADDKHHSVDVTFQISNSNVSRRETRKVVVSPLSRYNMAIGKKSETEILAIPGNPLQNAFDGNPETYFAASASSAAEPSITLTLNKQEYVNTVYITENTPTIGGYTVAYSNDGSKWTELTSGSITDQISRLISFDIVNPKYLKITFNDIARKSVSISEIGAYLETDKENMAQIDLNAIYLDTTKQITGNIELPTTGKYGTAISWMSSESSVISTSGAYTAPVYDTKVTLTAYTMADGKRIERSFELYAKGTAGAKGGAVVSGGKTGGGGSSSPAVMPPTISSTSEPAEKALFTDVEQSHWAYGAIKNLKDAGIIDGVGNGSFEPDSAVTREQFLKMLLIAGKVTVQGNTEFVEFFDVRPGEWYFDYVSAARREGIVNGISDTLFGIGRNISRQDMSVMIWRVLNGIGMESRSNVAHFADHGDISEYAAEAVYKLKALGIVQGYDNMFNPTDNLTRAEAAAVISALYGMIGN